MAALEPSRREVFEDTCISLDVPHLLVPPTIWYFLAHLAAIACICFFPTPDDLWPCPLGPSPPLAVFAVSSACVFQIRRMEDVYTRRATPGCVKEGYLFKKSSSKMLQVLSLTDLFASAVSARSRTVFVRTVANPSAFFFCCSKMNQFSSLYPQITRRPG